MGQVIVGAMAGTWVSITTSVQLTTSIQNKTEMVIEGSKVIPVLLQNSGSTCITAGKTGWRIPWRIDSAVRTGLLVVNG